MYAKYIRHYIRRIIINNRDFLIVLQEKKNIGKRIAIAIAIWFHQLWVGVHTIKIRLIIFKNDFM